MIRRSTISPARLAGLFAFAFLSPASAAATDEVDAGAAQPEAPRDDAGTPADAVIPPRLVVDSPATYPSDASDAERAVESVVVLVLQLDDRGAVTRAEVRQSAGAPFDAAALQAAPKLVFAPATRGGVPIAVKIGFRYTFDAPKPPAQLETVSPPPVAASSSETIEEVTVRGSRPSREATRVTVSRDEIDHIPGTGGDALRSIQNLPGVARPPPYSGLLIVRGSAPEDTNIFLDGTSIPLAFHLGGLSSIVPSELLERIDYYPGNFSVVYGRGTGGMIDIAIRKPKSDKLHGLAQVDFIDARVLAEGPIAKTGWNFAIGARRSWIDAWLGPVLKAAGVGVSTAPRYYDYQAILQHDFSSKSSFQLTLIGSNDGLEILNSYPDAARPIFSGTVNFDTNFFVAQARYETRFTPAMSLKTMLSYKHTDIDFGLGVNYLRIITNPVALRTELTQRISPHVTQHTGIDFGYGPYSVRVRFPQFRAPGEPAGAPNQVPLETRNSGAFLQPAVYSEWELTLWRGSRIVPGLRVDYNSQTGTWDTSPRIIVRQDLTSSPYRTTIKGSTGLFFQPPQPPQTDAVFGQSGLKSIRSVSSSIGLEQELSSQIDASIDFYYKALDRLITPKAGNSGEGRVFGAEMLVRYKPDARFFGWLSYSLSRSERRDFPDKPLHLFQYDQTHILTVLGSYKVAPGWQVGARFRLVSGALYTPNTYGPYDATSGSELSVAAYPPFGSRMPAFHQLDVRADRTWEFKSWKLRLYLDIQNVYYAKNPEGLSYNFNSTKSSYVTGLPILPSLGLRGEF